MYDPKGNHVPITLDRAVKHWPTPTTQDAANNGGPSQWDRNSLPLNTAVKAEAQGMWPTPTADLARAGRGDRPSELARKSPGLETIAMLSEKWPTPTAQDSAGSRRTTARTEEWTSNPGTTLTDAAIISTGQWDGKPMKDGTELGRLNPRWVATLMGYPPTWAVPSGPRPPASRSTRGRSRASSPTSDPTDGKP